MVQAGATLQATALCMSDVARIGVEVADFATSATLAGCLLAHFRFPHAPHNRGASPAVRGGDAAAGGSGGGGGPRSAGGTAPCAGASPSSPPNPTNTGLHVHSCVAGFGVYAHSESHVNLRNVSMDGAQVHISSAATAELIGCTLSATPADCASLSFTGGAQGSAFQCMLLRSSVGVSVSGADSKLALERSFCVEHALCGIHVCDAAKVIGTQCNVSACTAAGAGVLVATGAVADLREGGCTGGQHGVCVWGGGRVFARHITVQGCARAGFDVYEGGAASCVQCTVKRCKGAGAMVSHRGSKIDLKNCRVVQCNGNGVGATAGARAALKYCVVSRSKSNCGLWAYGKGTEVELEECRLEGNSLCAVFASSRAVVGLRGCTSMGNKVGFKAVFAANVALTRCCSRRDAADCEVFMKGRIVLEDFDVDGVPRNGKVFNPEEFRTTSAAAAVPVPAAPAAMLASTAAPAAPAASAAATVSAAGAGAAVEATSDNSSSAVLHVPAASTAAAIPAAAARPATFVCSSAAVLRQMGPTAIPVVWEEVDEEDGAATCRSV